MAVTPRTVGKWRKRFVELRLDGLHDELRPGGPRKIDDAAVEAVVVETLEAQPRAATHPSSRETARKTGLSVSSVQRIQRAADPAGVRTATAQGRGLKLSSDPLFIGKVRDVVELPLDPPGRALVPCVGAPLCRASERPCAVRRRALVPCVDETSRMQALDRSQPIPPLRPGTPERRTHDDKRHGVTSPFAAVDPATGEVVGKCDRRHRAVEFGKFLGEIEADVPDDLDIHIVMDNCARHETPAIRARFAKRPTASSPSTTTTQSPSSGQPTQPASSPPSNVGT